MGISIRELGTKSLVCLWQASDFFLLRLEPEVLTIAPTIPV